MELGLLIALHDTISAGPGDLQVSSQKLYVAVFYNAFGTNALPIFVKEVYIDGFSMNLAHVLGLLFIKIYMLKVFTMNLAHLLVPFLIKFRRRPKAIQGA